MLRLKPSELTLTPDDIDETLRRMARRQQSRPPAAQGQRRTKPNGRPPPPKLVSGAQRSVRDAITHLGNMPALQPQHAMIAHVDDESDETDETLADPVQRVESSPDPVSLYTHPVQLASASSTAVAPSHRHSTRLPFRLGRSRRRQDNDQELASSPKEHSDDSEGTLVEPPGLPTETTAVADPATPSRRRQIGESNAGSSPIRQRSPPASPPSLRGGASRPQRNRVRSVGQEALYAPSPLRQAQVPSPAYSPEVASPNSDEGRPRMHLKGYFADRQDPVPRRVDSGDFTEATETMSATSYTFQETVPRAPHTEPFRRTSQPRFHSRSQSSNDAPPSRLFVPTPHSPYISQGEDIFWTASTSTPECSINDKLGSRARQHSSEMSNTSLAYSYYELPDNRQSSGEHSAQVSLSQSQHDGVAASRQASRGTYRSFKLSDGRSLHPAGDPSKFPVLIRRPPDQQSASPLPAEPYGRPSAGNLGTRFQQAIHRYVSSDSSSREVPTDATAATMEERASPLDVLEAQIERASHHVGEQQGRQYRRSHPESGQSAYRTAGPGISSFDQFQFTYGASSNAFDQPASMLGPSQGEFGAPMAMADDPYTRGVSAHVGRSYGSTVRPISAQPVPAASHAAPPYARSTHGGRSVQRSSENAPVGSSGQERRTARASQVQDHVSAFEQMQNAAQPRHTRQRTEVPQEAPVQHQHEQQSSPIFGAPIWSVPPRHSSHQHGALSPGQGNAGRRSARMDPRLQNQENSGEAEIEMMRQELESVRMRHDEGQQGDVMDETPPRIGRVERHM
ncbi:uncharacterized protein M421DRAFT_385694 [Didymella exigua CBS 183.55]|uniref:Uncharacterized protein n=1 Tax=Didymella exigua CBS 183.55 TaxID=1150837 RepID=A0A6A5RSS0_9PLEO|nr:uncharacterized protein M421DRAFT_385694 [Didymella exigua CBS 183.55]KAF1930154.1 hypothetical protein M421DRAFT_385694 [Didymella exigua CBS 183.55]